MFYIKLNGELLPTPYQYIEDANAAKAIISYKIQIYAEC